MKIYGFQKQENHVLVEIDNKENRFPCKPVDHNNLVNDELLLAEIENFLKTTFEDKLEEERVAFTLAVKLKAVVFKDDILMFEKEEIKPLYKTIVMSDFSEAIFWDEEGCCVGGSEGPYSFKISKELQRELREWHQKFKVYPYQDYSEFDWASYHTRGIELAKKVESEFGDLIEIIYQKPFEDPNNKIDELTLIT